MKYFYLPAIAFLLSLSQAEAQSPTAPAQSFNVFVQGDATFSTSDCEGPIAIGGNLNVNGGYVCATHSAGTFTPPGFTTNIGLLVGGKVNLNSGNFQVNSNGYVKIGDNTGTYVWYVDNNGAYSPIRITPNSSNYSASNLISLQTNSQNLGVSATTNPVYQSGLIDFSTALSTMQATATSLAACSNNMTLYTSPNGGTQPTSPNSIPSNSQIYTSVNSSGNTVLDIDGAHLNNFQQIAWQLPSGSASKPSASHMLIINVDAPGSYTWNVPNMGMDNSNASYVIWNFYNTTSLTISGNGAVEGTVFAPNADITKSGNNSNIEGQVIGLSYNQNNVGGEVHYYPFTGSVSGCGVTTSPTVASFTIDNAAQCLNGNSFNFTNTSTGTSPYTYSWNFGDNSSAVTTANAAHTYSASGTYNVKCVVTGAGGTDSVTHTVVVYATPATPGAFTTSAATVYQGQRNVSYAIAADTGVSYTWSYSGTGATITGSSNSVSITFSTTATAGNLSVTETSSHGCGTTSPLTMAINVLPYETFNCNAGNDWNTASNWDGGFVPYGTISAYVPASASCHPSVGITDSVNNLVIDNGAAITMTDNGKIDANGNVTLNGDITGGYLNLTGGSSQTISGNGTTDYLSLNNTHGATINNGDTIHIKVAYSPGTGTLTTNGGLELLSDSTGTASILAPTSGCNYISGDVICDKYIHGGRRAWRFFGHPFSSSIGLDQLIPYVDITGNYGSDSGFVTTPANNPSAYWYNTLTGNGSSVDDSTGWIPFTSTDGIGVNAWAPTEGMRMFVRGAKGEGICCPTGYVPSPITLKMHGPVNECNVVVTLKTNSNYGYNFIGNPYACDIDLKQTTRGNAIGANFCVWDPNQGTQGAYVEQPFNYSYILPAYSSFTTTCSHASGKTITFKETSKTSANPTGTLFRTTSGFGNDVVQLHVLTNNDSVSWDRLLIFFNDQALSGFDDNDGTKFGNPDLDFYSFSEDDSELAVDQRPFVNGQVIKLGLKTDTLQTYTIRVDDYDVPSGGQLYLHDKYLGSSQPISLGMHYTFSVTNDEASQGDNRFEINVVDSNVSVNTVVNSEMRVSMYPNPVSSLFNVSFEAPQKGNTFVTISNIVGQQMIVKSFGEMKNGTIKVPVQDLSAGVYIVTFKCGDLTYTQRFVKQ